MANTNSSKNDGIIGTNVDGNPVYVSGVDWREFSTEDLIEAAKLGMIGAAAALKARTNG